jgi:hypothetical protein
MKNFIKPWQEIQISIHFDFRRFLFKFDME